MARSRKVTRAAAAAVQPLAGELEHAGGEIESDHRFESLGEVGQKRARSATEVGRRLSRSAAGIAAMARQSGFTTSGP